MLSRSYFSKIRPLPQKHCALMPFFSIFSWKSPICHAHICSKKREFCQNYTILWGKNVNRILFFSDFSRKNHSFHPIFCQQNVHSLKNHCSNAHVLTKKRSFSWKHRAVMSFVLISHEKPNPAMPIFGQKT